MWNMQAFWVWKRRKHAGQPVRTLQRAWQWKVPRLNVVIWVEGGDMLVGQPLPFLAVSWDKNVEYHHRANTSLTSKSLPDRWLIICHSLLWFNKDWHIHHHTPWEVTKAVITGFITASFVYFFLSSCVYFSLWMNYEITDCTSSCQMLLRFL